MCGLVRLLREMDKEKLQFGGMRNWVSDGALVQDGKDRERNMFVDKKSRVYFWQVKLEMSSGNVT